MATAQPNPIDLTTLAAVKSWAGVPANVTTEDDNIQRCITAASAYWLWYTGKSSENVTPSQSPFNQPVAYNENYDGSGSERQFVRTAPIQSVQALTIGNVPVQQSTVFGQPGWVIDSGAKSISIRGGGGGSQSFTTTLLTPFLLAGQFFVKGLQNVNIQYTAGYPLRQIANELDTIPAASGSPLRSIITVQVLPWIADGGVKDFGTGNPYTLVNVAPSTGQYFLLGAGQYLFSSSDAGKDVLISYSAAGTPPDVEFAARQMVTLNYKRKNWIDEASRAMAGGAGTVSYRGWIVQPEVKAVMDNYRRVAIVG